MGKVDLLKWTARGLIIGGTAASLQAMTAPVETSPLPDNPPGNNGTVDMHPGNGEPNPITRDFPQFCGLAHAHFFFADKGQSGDWKILVWSPGGDRVSVFTQGSYDTGTGRDYRTDPINFPEGHYRLDFNGRNDKNVKHKEFWEHCETPATPTPPPPTKGATETRAATRTNTPRATLTSQPTLKPTERHDPATSTATLPPIYYYLPPTPQVIRSATPYLSAPQPADIPNTASVPFPDNILTPEAALTALAGGSVIAIGWALMQSHKKDQP